MLHLSQLRCNSPTQKQPEPPGTPRAATRSRGVSYVRVEEATVIAQVSIDAEGSVVVVCDSDDALDEDEQRLQGLRLDDMVARAARTAIDTWFALRNNEADDEPAAS